MILVVQDLRIDVVTGTTCYPGEEGFASTTVEAAAMEPALVEKLTKAYEQGQVVTVRCARLQVTGKIEKITQLGERGKKYFRIDPDDISYVGRRSAE